MAKILAKHSKPKDEVMPSEPVREHESGPGVYQVAAGVASAENTLRLKWQKLSEWYAITECGRYRCRKWIPGESIDVDPQLPLYQLEYRVEGLWFYRLGSPLNSWPEARAMAQKHSELSK